MDSPPPPTDFSSQTVPERSARTSGTVATKLPTDADILRVLQPKITQALWLTWVGSPALALL